MKKIVIAISSVLIVSVAIIVLLVSIKSGNNTTGVTLEDFRTNRTQIEPLLTRFPKLKKIETCLWQSAVISNGRSDIGPTSYWMQGYIVLNSETFKSYKSNYKWSVQKEFFENNNFVLENGEKVSLPDENKINISNSKWAFSKEFNDYIIGDFIGSFYLDLNNGVLFFDVQNK